MDGNRDDALRCEAIGKEAMRVQDFSKALKFFQKSLRLYPSDNVSRFSRPFDHSHPELRRTEWSDMVSNICIPALYLHAHACMHVCMCAGMHAIKTLEI